MMSRTRRGRRFFGSVRADLFVPYEFVMRLPRSGEQLPWNHPRSFVTAVMPSLVGNQLWVARSYARAGELSVDGLQKVYDIEGLTKTASTKVASPRHASFRITFPRSEMSVEQQCLERLKGLEVRLAPDYDRGLSLGDVWTLTITDISYGALVDPRGPWTLDAPTDRLQVTLVMSEGLGPMALRKSVEHLWALPTSLALMLLWAAAVHVRRAVKLRQQAPAQARHLPPQSVPQDGGPVRSHPRLNHSPETKPTRRSSRRRRRPKHKRH